MAPELNNAKDTNVVCTASPQDTHRLYQSIEVVLEIGRSEQRLRWASASVQNLCSLCSSLVGRAAGETCCCLRLFQRWWCELDMLRIHSAEHRLSCVRRAMW